MIQVYVKTLENFIENSNNLNYLFKNLHLITLILIINIKLKLVVITIVFF